MTFVKVLRDRAREGRGNGFSFLPDRDRPAIDLSFTELDRQARAVAASLQARGCAGSRALLCYPPGIDFLPGLFGCLYAGVIAVPVYPPRASRADTRLESIHDASKAVTLLTNTQVLRDRGRLTAHAARLNDLHWLDTSALPVEAADRWVDPGVRPDDLAFLQYTSGSTGLPKGVMLTHAALLHNVGWMQHRLGLSATTSAVCWLPAFHDMGLIGNFLQTVYSGASMTVLSPATFAQDPLLWLQMISHRRAYVSGGPTFAFRHCVQRMTPEKCRDLDLSSWKVAYVGSEPVAAAVLDRFVEVFGPYGFARTTFYPCYGLAEATLMVTGGDRFAPPIVRSFARAGLEQHHAILDEAGQAMVGCGTPLPNMDVRIVDPEVRQMLPDGRVGEIWVAGPSVARGYWDRPEDTQSTFGARLEDGTGPFLRTGDLGFLDRGELFVSGRLKDVIIIRGRNYYPQDLEAAAAEACPELARSALVVFALDTPSGPELVLLAEAGRDHRQGTAAALLARARQGIAELFELDVQRLVLTRVGAVPKSTSGKTQRLDCTRRFQEGALPIIEEAVAPAPLDEAIDTAPSPAPQDTAAIRDWLLAWVGRQLGTPAAQVDPYQAFATFGLSSLTMVTMVTQLQQWLGRAVAPTMLYSYPTPDALARFLGGEPVPDAEPAGPLTPTTGNVPIAVIGIGCRFPGAHDASEFWRLLRDGVCAVGAMPIERDAGITAPGGYLDDVANFDAAFFGIAAREATVVDPQHRLLLEVAWQTLEHGGVPADQLAGKPVGVFVGISNNDYGRIVRDRSAGVPPYAATGNAASMAAHRLSYHLDLHGPSIAVDTACSSSLVAVHLACQSLRTGECDVALAGGVNLILTHELTDALTGAAMLSPTGLCKTFDDTADGYVRGEGCGLVLLKPLPAALRDGDRVLALLEASAVNQDGLSNGITAPNGAAQASLIGGVLASAGCSPADVTCVEAHGTGTPLGDPVEFDALQTALGSAATACALSSVKTNLGHLESAAGIAGLIKVVLQLHNAELAPHLHLRRANARITLDASRFFIPQEATAWPANAGPRRATVSSFGFGGTNACMLVASAPTQVAEPTSGSEPPLRLLPLAARSESALKRMAHDLARWLRGHPDTSFSDVCSAAARNRTHFPHRVAVRGHDGPAVAEALTEWANGQPHPACHAGYARQPLTGRIAFVFTGQGLARAATGRRLFDTCAVFRHALQRCDRIVGELGAGSIHAALADPQCLNRTEVAQPILFALEYALAVMWRHWGIEPAALLGHSVGEYVAACVAGVLSLDDALGLVVRRGALMQACPEGAMLACFAPEAEVRERIARRHPDIEVAVLNGPDNTVVAGRPGPIAALRTELAADGIACRPLNVDRAFHSALIEPALPGLREAAAGIAHRDPVIPLVSNVTGGFLTTAPAPDYWAGHARSPVQFAAGVRKLNAAGITHFIEIGPDAILCRLGPTCLRPSEPNVWLPSLRHNTGDGDSLGDSLSRLFVDGANVRWEHFDARTSRRHLDLPSYPFDRQRYWIDARPKVAPSTPRPGASGITPTWRPWSAWMQDLPRAPLVPEPLPNGLADAIASLRPGLSRAPGVSDFATLRQAFDRLAGAYVVNTLHHLGWSPQNGDAGSVGELVARCKVVRPYDRLLDRLLQIAEEDRWLQRSGESWHVVAEPVMSDVEALHRDLLQGYAGFAADLRLAHRCAIRMHLVMRGEADPLEVVFGDEAGAWAEGIYRQSPLAQFYNGLLVSSVRTLVERFRGRGVVRILEIGAGTGGTTAPLLPALADAYERAPVEYLFTDISKLFLARARQEFDPHRFVHYRTLDIEKTPAHQGFAEGQLDLIVAANVLHATADLRGGLRHARELLSPGGVLALLEGTGPRRLLDLIFGLTDGWWRFTDVDLRPHYPLLAPDTWQRLLAEEGFTDFTTIPTPGEDLADPDQVVILARRSNASHTQPATRHSAPAITWVVAGGSAGIADALAERLQHDGDRVLRVADGDHLAAVVDAAGAAGSLHLVDCTDAGRNETRHSDMQTRFAAVWAITRGVVGPDIDREDGSSLCATRGATRLIDLDPAQPVADAVTCLVQALRHPDEQTVVAYRDYQRYIPRERDTDARQLSAAAGFDRAAARASEPVERQRLIAEYLQRELRVVLGAELAPADMDRPLQALGLDSLMGLQLRNRIEAQLGLSLSVVEFFKGLTFAQIVGRALQDLGDQARDIPSAGVPPRQPPAHLTSERVEQLPEEDLNALLSTLLK